MFSKSSLSFLTSNQKIKIRKITKKPNISLIRNEILKGNFPRPQFGLGILMGFLQASQLNYKNISILEFNLLDDEDALIDLINYSKIFESLFKIKTNVFSIRYNFNFVKKTIFDRKYEFSNIKEKSKKYYNKKFPLNYIDGDNPRKITKIKKALEKAPLAFCSFDLKNNTITNKALKLFKTQKELFLPRAVVYFDHLFKSNENEGEYLSIIDLNRKSKNKKISSLMELSEQLSTYWFKWLFLGKRIKILASFDHRKYSFKCKKLF